MVGTLPPLLYWFKVLAFLARAIVRSSYSSIPPPNPQPQNTPRTQRTQRRHTAIKPQLVFLRVLRVSVARVSFS